MNKRIKIRDIIAIPFFFIGIQFIKLAAYIGEGFTAKEILYFLGEED